MNCAQCGQSVNEGSRFCGQCGSPVVEEGDDEDRADSGTEVPSPDELLATTPATESMPPPPPPRATAPQSPPPPPPPPAFDWSGAASRECVTPGCVARGKPTNDARCQLCGFSTSAIGAPPPSATPPPFPGAPQPYPVAYAPPVAQGTNGLSIASLVLGILWIYWIGSILALIFGYVAKGQIDRSGGRQGGRGMAIAGIVLGWIGVGIFLLLIVVGVGVGLGT